MRSEVGPARRAGSPALTERTLIRLVPPVRSTSALVPARNHFSLGEALAFAQHLRARLLRRVLDRWVRAVASTISGWVARARSRRELLDLNDRALLDLGLTRADVWRESSKPFWKV
jgi:uncharacterized protein YjiS (DUF1127 family)